MIKIRHISGWSSSIDTYIATDVASFNVFTTGRKITIVRAVRGRNLHPFARDISEGWEESVNSGTPYEFVRRFWAKCLAERYAGVET